MVVVSESLKRGERTRVAGYIVTGIKVPRTDEWCDSSTVPIEDTMQDINGEREARHGDSRGRPK